MKKLINLLIVALILIVFFTGCQTKQIMDTEKEVTEQILKFMIPSEPQDFDPTISSESYSAPLIYHAFEPLVRINEDGEIIPASAESWVVSNNNSTFTFKLRDNLKWSDGTSLKAEDFKKTFVRILSEDTNSQNSGLLTPFILNSAEYLKAEVNEKELGVKVIDEYTLEIKTYYPTPFFLQVLAFANFSPVRIDIIEAYGENWDKEPEHFISNGPFKLIEYVNNDYVLLEKNMYYWNAENIQIDKIKLIFRNSEMDITRMYENHEIYGVYEISVSELRRMPEIETDSYSNIIPSTAFLIINHENEFMSEVRFREALSIGIDRKSLVDKSLLGSGIPSKYLIPLIFRIDGEAFHEYVELDQGPDLVRALELIDELRTEGKLIDRALKIMVLGTGPDSTLSKQIAEEINTNLKLEVEFITMPWAELFNEAQNNDYDIIMMGWGADYPHPMTFLSTFLTDAVYSNLIRWSDPLFDQKTQEFLKITDEREALNALRELEAMILDEYHIIPIYHRKGLCLMSDKVKGWYRTPSSQFDFTKAWIEE